MLTKTCKCCELDLPVASFYAHNSTADGLGSWCKDCTSDRARASRKEKQEAAKAAKERGYQIAKMEIQPNGLPRHLAAAKWCRGCLSFKHKERDFHKNSRARDGVHARCKACASETAREGYVKRKQKALVQRLMAE